ncbi:MAG: peptidoglycan DD-metalloendopeptidase family protein [Clostridia bacterium]|nr:peptidoglycan DD-metalloendopeptidase family protein [Clostridia bacterium]
MKKRVKAASIFYICLAVLSLAVGITTYTIMTNRLGASLEELENSVPDLSLPDTSVINNEKVVESKPKPKKQEEAPTPAPVPKEPVKEKKVWYNMPLVGTVSADFSDSVLVFSPTMMDYRTHMGVDIAAAVGTPVKAVADGVVTNVYEDDMLGVTVEITHNDGKISRYCNLSPTLSSDCVKDAEISALTVIGAVGETAVSESAEASHLHLEILDDGIPLDPMTVINN